MGRFKLKKIVSVVKKVATPKNLMIAAAIGVTGGTALAALAPGGITGVLGKVAGKLMAKQMAPEEQFPSVDQSAAAVVQPGQSYATPVAQAPMGYQQAAPSPVAKKSGGFWAWLFGRG